MCRAAPVGTSAARLLDDPPSTPTVTAIAEDLCFADLPRLTRSLPEGVHPEFLIGLMMLLSGVSGSGAACSYVRDAYNAESPCEPFR